MARVSGHCFDLHGIIWNGSLLSVGGRRMLCHFTSPDAESVRSRDIYRAAREVAVPVTSGILIIIMLTMREGIWPSTLRLLKKLPLAGRKAARSA